MIPLAILAGVAQALGSVLGKFAFGEHSVLPALAIETCSSVFRSAPSVLESCWMASYPVRGVLMLAMMTSNSYGLMMMVNGMKQSGSFLGTVLVTASNFILSALFGSVVFGEALSVWWWSGTVCILGGVILIVSEASSDGSSSAPAVSTPAPQKPKAA